MDCPLTNQGTYTFTFRIGANVQEKPANQISVHLYLDQSYRAFSVRAHAETEYKKLINQNSVSGLVSKIRYRITFDQSEPSI
jgi:hypothetical protein